MDKILDCFISYLVKQKFVKNEDVELVQIGLLQAILYLINICITLIIGVFFHEPYASICFLLSFMAIRTFSGGFHACSIVRCFILSVVIIIIVIASIHYLLLPDIIVFLSALCSGVLLWIISPVDNVKRKLDFDDKLKYKKIAQKILFVEMFFIIMGYILKLEWLYEGVTAGLCITSILAVIGRVQMKKYNNCIMSLGE